MIIEVLVLICYSIAEHQSEDSIPVGLLEVSS